MKRVTILFTIFISLNCFSQSDLKSFLYEEENTELQQKFEDFIKANCKIHISELETNKKQPLEVYFYKMNKRTYVRIVETIGISFKKIKGYCEYENYMIAYYGVSDSLATKYLKLKFLDIERLKLDYFDIDVDLTVDLKNDRINDYKIEKSVFKKFKPTHSHLFKYRKILIDAGVFASPPPSPLD